MEGAMGIYRMVKTNSLLKKCGIRENDFSEGDVAQLYSVCYLRRMLLHNNCVSNKYNFSTRDCKQRSVEISVCRASMPYFAMWLHSVLIVVKIILRRKNQSMYGIVK
jgi:hypothetical protein